MTGNAADAFTSHRQLAAVVARDAVGGRTTRGQGSRVSSEDPVTAAEMSAVSRFESDAAAALSVGD
jgi:hypothetical protein